MDLQSFEQAKQYALHRLESELPSHLLYHGIAHTRDDVVFATETLANMEGVTGESFFVLLTAAWFHDLGFVEQSVHHELISARIAVQVLPDFGYTHEQIETIRWAILATALPQSPKNLLEEILTDADLAVLGREDFLTYNENLRGELKLLGKEFTDEQWYTGQVKFIEEHTYFTASARKLWDTNQAKNTFNLKKKLEETSQVKYSSDS